MAHRELSSLFREVCKGLLEGREFKVESQSKSHFCSLDELEQGKYITGKETSVELQRKIRAYWNPPYSGAKVVLNGKEYTIVDDFILRYIAEHTGD